MTTWYRLVYRNGHKGAWTTDLKRINKRKGDIEMTNSRHYTKDRKQREAIIAQIGTGNVIKEVVVDRGHRNGPEVHKITDTALILVYNQRTGILVTKLIARPAQILRYYKEDEPKPTRVVELARVHARNKWNEM